MSLDGLGGEVARNDETDDDGEDVECAEIEQNIEAALGGEIE
jgi:hypothetical protein